MTRFAPIALAALALTLALPTGLRAQSDPNTYSDPAMSFTAPSDYTPLPVPTTSPDAFEQPTVVAAYIKHAKQSDATIVTLQMQNYSDNLESFESQVETTDRNQGGDSVFVKKDLTTLSNGMPAYYLSVTISQDSGESRIFQYVWVDGVRGATLSVSGRFGTIDDNAAKKILSKVSAVAYPKNRY